MSFQKSNSLLYLPCFLLLRVYKMLKPHLYSRLHQQQPTQQRQQPLYYVQPSSVDSALGSTQLDAFLRGHNIQF